MNFVSNLIGHMIDQSTTSLPYSEPLSSIHKTLPTFKKFIVKERPLSLTGEDYDIFYLDNIQLQFMRIRGSTLSLIPGILEMKAYVFDINGDAYQVAKLKRNSGDICLYRDTEKLFDSKMLCRLKIDEINRNAYVYLLKIEDGEKSETIIYSFLGNFVDRKVIMKNSKNETVAKITQVPSTEAHVITAGAVATKLEKFVDNSLVQNYEVEIAAGMDAVFVLCLVCALDEEYDAQRKRQEEK